MEYARFIAVRCGSFGYFSAHAASSTGLAVFVGLLLKRDYPKMPYLMLIWAVIVSYSRIYVGVHYPLDVVTGMLIGAILGYLFYGLHSFLAKKFKVNF
jgi:undecaprenyl-diphosphatase